MTAVPLRRGTWWSMAARVGRPSRATAPGGSTPDCSTPDCSTPDCSTPASLLPRKDFGALPVCGSVRPTATQRARAASQD
jgi:hypothetical protein